MIAKTILNKATIRSLVEHHVVCYNFTTGRWNTKHYNGYIIQDQETDTMAMKAFRATMNVIPEFSAQYEMGAVMTMTINRELYTGCGNQVATPIYDWHGTAVVGNIIVWNKATQTYELYCKSWVGISDYSTRPEAAIYGPNRFAQRGIATTFFRKKLIAAHTR